MRRKALSAACLAAPFAGLLALGAPASAHDIWLDPTGSGVQVLYGHPHEPELPSAGKLMSLTAYEPSDAVVLKAKLESGPAPALRAAHQGDALFAAAYDNGYWVRLPDGSYRNASKRMLPQADKSLWSVKFAKAVSSSAAPWDKIVGQPLEIVPLEAPTSASGKIRVRVLFEGRPLNGASVVATDGVNFKSDADQARATTDAEGVAVVALRRAGPQVLGVSHRVTPSQTPALADSDSYGATLAFTVTDPKTN
ncbi:Putative GH25 family protein [Methylorubrum aminovorans]